MFLSSSSCSKPVGIGERKEARASSRTLRRLLLKQFIPQLAEKVAVVDDNVAQRQHVLVMLIVALSQFFGVLLVALVDHLRNIKAVAQDIQGAQGNHQGKDGAGGTE